MSGLLDFIGTPEGQGLLSAAFGGMASARQGTPWNNAGRAGVSGLVGYNQALDQSGEIDQRKQRQQLFELQLKQMQQQQADAQLARDNEATFRASITSPQQSMLDNALADGQGPTTANAAKLAPVDPRDQQLWQAMSLGQIKPLDYVSAITKDRTPIKLGEGDTLLDPKTFQPLAKGAPKASDETSDVRNYQFAVGQGYTGSFTQFQLEQRRAGATNVTTTYGAPMEGVDANGNRVFFRAPNKGGKVEVLPDIAPVPDKVPESTRAKLAENAVVLEKIRKAQALTEQNPSAFGLQNVLGDTVMQRFDAGGTDVRSLVADIAGQKIHDRSGGAVSVGESERLKPYVPNVTDTADTVKKKLKNFEAEYAAMQRELSTGATVAQVSAAKAETPARKYNPATGKLE